MKCGQCPFFSGEHSCGQGMYLGECNLLNELYRKENSVCILPPQEQEEIKTFVKKIKKTFKKHLTNN